MMSIADPQPNDAFAWTQEPWGRALRCSRLPASHLFTSRDVVLRDDRWEWDMVAASLGVAIDRLLLIRQVHGNAVAVARRGHDDDWRRPEADIVVTDDPDVAIGVRVADCAPVLLYDPVRNVAGAAHAGWRGTAVNASGAAVTALQRDFGSDPAHVIAAIGPCLGACCGEVGPEVADAFRSGGASGEDVSAWFSPGQNDRSLLDLERANRDQLARAGLSPDRIFSSGLCTKTHAWRLHSYRADRAAAGRILGAIRVPRR
jgi:purine-nucleoside/S-methyl-5'-thioadenosine phosphorylase / adenosine deaminase